MGMYLNGMFSEENGGETDCNLLLGIACVPKRVETTSPRGNSALVRESDDTDSANDASSDRGCEKQVIELLRGDVGANELNEGDDLKKTKDTWKQE